MKAITRLRSTLTPALSHRMGEGKLVSALMKSPAAGLSQKSFEISKRSSYRSLSRQTGEGQGEGII
jgi:hypothetical protein